MRIVPECKPSSHIIACVPRPRVIYPTAESGDPALKSETFLVIAHGTAEAVQAAKSILEHTRHATLADHHDQP